MEDKKDIIRRKFKPLDNLSLQRLKTPSKVEFPELVWLISLILSKKPSFPLGLVFPARSNIASCAAILYALYNFKSTFNSIRNEYAEIRLKQGQRVRIHPSGHVYIYDGIWADYPDRFRLRTLDGSTRRALPVSDVLRLEATNRTNPKGKADTPLGDPQVSDLGRILKIRTYGNTCLIKNNVILLDHRNSFEKFVSNHAFFIEGNETPMQSLKEMLPFGIIDSNGILQKWDSYNPSGEPLVAVTSRIENIAELCVNSQPNSKTIIADGLALASSNLQAFDTLCEKQSLIIIGDRSEDEYMPSLSDRGCIFWFLDPISSEPNLTHDKLSTLSPFREYYKCAVNKGKMYLDFRKSESETIDSLANCILQVNSLRLEDSVEGVQRLAKQLFGLILWMSEWLRPPCKNEHEKFLTLLEQIESGLRLMKQWIPLQLFKSLEEGVRIAHEAVSTYDHLGSGKAEAILREFENIDSFRGIGVLVRSSRQKKHAEEFLRDMFSQPIDVFTIKNMPSKIYYDCIYCLGWPRSNEIITFINKYVTARLCYIGYPFELNWYSNSIDRALTIPKVRTIEEAELSKLRLTKYVPSLDKKTEPAVERPHSRSANAQIWDFENTLRRLKKGGRIEIGTNDEVVKARYVSFHGPGYIYFSDSHSITMLPEINSKELDQELKVLTKQASDLEIGDHIVIRESGQRDVIHDLADGLLGSDASALRQKAKLWIDALRNCGLEPGQIERELRKRKRPRSSLTIRNWLSRDDMIGPSQKADLEAIAAITDNSELMQIIDDIWDAITIIRTAHIKAGHRLSNLLLEKLPSIATDLYEGTTEFDLGSSITAWLLIVEEISAQYEEVPSYMANNLRWDRSCQEDLF